MLKKTMTYEDYNGVPRTEDFYFNLTPAEVTEMELSVDGGLVEMINRVVAAQDGKRFVKNQEIRDAFAQTNAYSDLFMELATDAKAAAAFVNGVIQQPKKAPAPAPQN